MKRLQHKGVHLLLPVHDRTFSVAPQRFVDEVLALADYCAVYALPIGGVFIDVGSCFGVSAITAVKHGLFHTAHAYEADPYNFTLLMLNIAANGLVGKVIPHWGAIADTRGVGWLRAADQRNIGAGFMLHDTAQVTDSDVPVPTDTLDNTLRKLNLVLDRCDLVWVDAQGSEGKVLRGATALSHDVPWYMELAPACLATGGVSLEEIQALLSARFTCFLDTQDIVAGRYDISRVREVHDACVQRTRHGKTPHTNLFLFRYTEPEPESHGTP